MWFVAVQFVVVYNISPKHYLFVTCAQINLDYDYKNPFLNIASRNILIFD